MQPRDDLRAELATLKSKRFLGAPEGSTILLGDSHAKRWPATLPVPGQDGPIINLGVGGDRIEDIHWRILQWPLALRSPKCVVVFAGGNNFVVGEEVPLILGRFRSLMEAIRQQIDCPLVAVGLLPRGKLFWYRPQCIAETNRGIDEMSREFSFKAVFANEALTKFGAAEGLRLYYSDMAHLSEAGYNIVASCF